MISVLVRARCFDVKGLRLAPITSSDGVDDRPVLGIRRLEILPQTYARRTRAMALVPQGVRERFQASVATQLDEATMEPLVGANPPIVVAAGEAFERRFGADVRRR